LIEKLDKENKSLTFTLQNDLLLLQIDNENPKIELPARLIGPPLACLHLIGHMGASKIIEKPWILRTFWGPIQYLDMLSRRYEWI
jgi:hypothetical protein